MRRASYRVVRVNPVEDNPRSPEVVWSGVQFWPLGERDVPVRIVRKARGLEAQANLALPGEKADWRKVRDWDGKIPSSSNPGSRNPGSAKFERCVQDVKASNRKRSGRETKPYNPWAVCHSSVGRNPSMRAQPVSERHSQSGFDVYFHGRHIDTVYFASDMTAADVKRSLVRHDGLDSRIVVKKHRIGRLPVRNPVRRPRAAKPFNEDHVDELLLYATNDEPSYRHAQAIMRNMAAKARRGVYDPHLAVKAWLHWADRAAAQYSKEYGTGSAIFSPSDRREAAKRAVDYYAEETAEHLRRLPALRRR